MPFVQIWIYKGQTFGHRQALMDGVQAAIADVLGIPAPNVFQALTELEQYHFRKPGWSSNNFTLVEISLFPGRDAETKKRLYQAIAGNLQKAPGISGSDLVIMLQELPRESWSVRDGLPATETGVPR